MRIAPRFNGVSQGHQNNTIQPAFPFNFNSADFFSAPLTTN